METRFVKVVLKIDSRGRTVQEISIKFGNERRAKDIMKYVTDILYMKGIFLFNGKKITNKDLDVQVEDNLVVTLKNYQPQNKILRDQTISVKDQRSYTVKIPPRITVWMMKLVIECECGILATNQYFKHAEWNGTNNDTRECTKDELRDLEVQDISIHTSEKDKTTGTTASSINSATGASSQPTAANTSSEDAQTESAIKSLCQDRTCPPPVMKHFSSMAECSTDDGDHDTDGGKFKEGIPESSGRFCVPSLNHQGSNNHLYRRYEKVGPAAYAHTADDSPPRPRAND